MCLCVWQHAQCCFPSLPATFIFLKLESNAITGSRGYASSSLAPNFSPAQHLKLLKKIRCQQLNPEKNSFPDSGLSLTGAHGFWNRGRFLQISEATSDACLQAACNLRVRTFYTFRNAYRIEEHKKFIAKREFAALKERIEGKEEGFKKVACVIATIPILEHLDPNCDLRSLCKIEIDNGVLLTEQLVVGSLDINQALRLPEELCGCKPKGPRAKHGRAYLSNVCVAKELQQRGIGSSLIKHAKQTAQLWGKIYAGTAT